jgi:hypothetical protein
VVPEPSWFPHVDPWAHVVAIIDVEKSHAPPKVVVP